MQFAVWYFVQVTLQPPPQFPNFHGSAQVSLHPSYGGGHSGGNPLLREPKGSEICLEQAALAVSGVTAVDRRAA